MWEGGIRVNAFVSGGFLPMAVRGTKLDGPHAMIHVSSPLAHSLQQSTDIPHPPLPVLSYKYDLLC